MPTPATKPIDLVLAGGGVKGIGLAGAVVKLMEVGYRAHRIAGSSAGSIVGSIVAAAAKNDRLTPADVRDLALAYGKALTLRKVYEEALEAFAAVKAEDVVDPSAYLFHKAVCEYELMLKDKADDSISHACASRGETATCVCSSCAASPARPPLICACAA